jgi:hypothetical protein
VQRPISHEGSSQTEASHLRQTSQTKSTGGMISPASRTQCAECLSSSGARLFRGCFLPMIPMQPLFYLSICRLRGESCCVLGTNCDMDQLIVQSPNERLGRAGPGRNEEGVRRRASQRPNAMRMQVFQSERAPRSEEREKATARAIMSGSV